MSATSDSAVYRQKFYGILSAEGDFWTPLAFESEERAWQHVRDFWGVNTEAAVKCLATFRIVPVRVQLTQLEAESAA